MVKVANKTNFSTIGAGGRSCSNPYNLRPLVQLDQQDQLYRKYGRDMVVVALKGVCMALWRSPPFFHGLVGLVTKRDQQDQPIVGHLAVTRRRLAKLSYWGKLVFDRHPYSYRTTTRMPALARGETP